MTDTKHEQAIEVLNRLIQVCRDGDKGYQTAASAVKTLDIKELFKSYSAQRASFATELATEIEHLGGKPADSGSLEATLHRGWMNLKSLLTGASDSAIAAECERGEDAALAVYKEALQADLPEEARAVVARQMEHLKEADQRIRALEAVRAKV